MGFYIFHGKNTADYNVFIREITTYNADVFTDPKSPQFLKVCDDDPQMLEPSIVVEDDGTELTVFQKLFEF